MVDALLCLTKSQLVRKCSEFGLETIGNKRFLAESLAEGRTAEDLGV